MELHFGLPTVGDVAKRRDPCRATFPLGRCNQYLGESRSPVRTQNFDLLGFAAVDGIAEGCADQCGGRPAEQCFRGGVDELDFTASIEHQHRFWLVCDQIPETRFAGAQRADQFPLPQDTAHARQQFVVRYRTNDIAVSVQIG